MSGPIETPFDPGLQPERTLLAWRRTCLALAVGCAVMVRFAGEAIGVWAALLGVVGVAASGVAYVRAAGRYRRAHDGLARDGRLPGDGSALALIAFALVVIGASAATFVVGVGVERMLR